MTVKKKSNGLALKSLDELFGCGNEVKSEVQMVPLESLYPFESHPYQVRDDEEMAVLIASIQESGVMVPGIVRMRKQGGYEIISGHRRKRASELAGLHDMPVYIKDLSDDEAIIMMADSNLHRELILPSEKAYAYKMKYDALKRKRGRKVSESKGQVGLLEENDTASDKKAQLGLLEENASTMEIMQKEFNTSVNQIKRYMHLTKLIPELLRMTDLKRIPFLTAVELSFLTEYEQQLVCSFIKTDGNVPSMKQAEKLKILSRAGELKEADILEAFNSVKADDINLKLKSQKLYSFFPMGYTPKQMEDVIYSLLQKWADTRKKA